MPPIIAVADLLSWRENESGALPWRDAFDRFLDARVHSERCRPAQGGAFGDGLRLLAESERRRFLRAPNVASLLLGHRQPRNESVFANLLLAELAARGTARELPRSCWTARGDRYLDMERPESWTLPGRVLGDTDIAIDERSSFAFPDDEFGIGETAPHDPDELGGAVDRLQSAIDLLRCACPAAFDFVTTCTEVIALRRAPGEAAAVHSSTFSGYPGLVRFTNVHLADADLPLAEALVHEAVHCLLYAYEACGDPFVAPEATRTPVESPWTGATISLHSYVHACVVWYGVWSLWSTEGFARIRGGGEGVLSMRYRAHAGFEHRPFTDGLAGQFHLVDPRVGELLEEIESRVSATPW